MSPDRELSTGEDFNFFSPIINSQISVIIFTPFEQLDDFIDENKYLYGLIGIFAALTGYLTTLIESTHTSTGEILRNFIFVTGFLIVILLTLVTYVKMLKKLQTPENRY